MLGSRMSSSWDDLLEPSLWKVFWGFMTRKLESNARAWIRSWCGHSLFASSAASLHSITRLSFLKTCPHLSVPIRRNMNWRIFEGWALSSFSTPSGQWLGLSALEQYHNLIHDWVQEKLWSMQQPRHIYATFVYNLWVVLQLFWRGSSSSSTASRAMTWGQGENNE